MEANKNSELVTGGQLVVDSLRSLGVQHVFGIPGGQTLAITDAIIDHEDIKFVTTRHEGAAACMADAVGRLSGIPGVCLATTGPGATNLLTGVGGALRDSSPVLVITCNNRVGDLGRDDTQAADHVAIFGPLTKWAVYVADSAAIPRVIHEAAIRATSGCPGPVLLDLARSALEGSVSTDGLEYPCVPKSYVRRVPGHRTYGDPAAIEQVISHLTTAERPVLWLGNGAQLSAAGDDALLLAERLELPVISTFNAIGVVESAHPNVFGPLSRMGTALSREVIRGADLLIAVGNSLNAVSTGRWALQLPDTIVQIDADPCGIGVNYPSRTLGVAGDAAAVARQLLEALSTRSLNPQIQEVRASRLQELRARKADWWARVQESDMSSSPMSPIALINALRNETPDDGILAVDAGNPGVWSHLWEIRRSGSYLKPVGFGNMGFALPAAIGAKLLEPKRPVVSLLGDGSLGMTMGDLETVAREDLAICIVVMNDLGYGNIRQEEFVHYGDRMIGVDFVDADYAQIAAGFGLAAHRADSADECAAAVRAVFDSGAPGLIDARIDPTVSAWTDALLTEQLGVI